MSMNKGEKSQPYIKRQECKQTNKLANETEQVINPLILTFPFLKGMSQKLSSWQ